MGFQTNTELPSISVLGAREVAFLLYELPNWVSKTNFLAVKSYTSKEHKMDSAGCIYRFVNAWRRDICMVKY